MAAVLSLTFLYQKRKPLSPAVRGFSLPCSLPAPMAVCVFQRTHRWRCFAVIDTQTVPACVPCPSPRAYHPSLSSFLCSDVTFVVGREQQKVFAHRCVLACRCQAFRVMFSQGLAGSKDSTSSIPPQGPFILGNVQPEVFLAVIEFLYTNSITLNSHIVSGGGIVGMGGTRWGCGYRRCFAAPGVLKVEGMLCKLFSG